MRGVTVNKKIFKTAAALLALVFTAALPVAAEDEGLPYSTYTYTRSGDMVGSPDVYTVTKNIKIIGSDGTAAKYPTDISTDKEGNLLIADSENNRVLCLDNGGKELWSIKNLTLDGKEYSLSLPHSILQTENGCCYISDAGELNENGEPVGNGRIYKLNAQRELIRIFEKPVIKQLADDGVSYAYRPKRFAVDSSERIYVTAENVNQGFIQLNKNGEFQGFIGAPAVKYDAFQLLVRKFSTKAQRARMQSFVPTEYSGVDIDGEGFIYVTTSTFNQSDLNSLISSQVGKGAQSSGKSTAETVRRLNASGSDVLRRRGAFSPIGDILIPNININGAPKLTTAVTRNQVTVTGSSRFTDIAAMQNGMYAALDENRGRIFIYDYDGNLFCAFGSSGGRQDSFSNPQAVEYCDGKLYVLNSFNGTVSVCEPTEYGKLLLAAAAAQYDGDVESSLELWNKVLAKNTNCEPAYDAIGKAYLDAEKAENAMRYFKLASNHEYYNQAFKIYRDDFIGRNFLWVALGIILIFAALSAVKKGMRCLAAANGALGIAARKNNACFKTLIHPFSGFYSLKNENEGSPALAIVQILLLGVSSVLLSNASGYCFNYTDIRYENIVFTYLTVILPYFLFIAANWCLITLFDGKGTLKDILVFTGCSTVPLTAANFINFALSHVCTTDEAAIMTVLSTLGTVWMLFLFFAATVTVHDYTALKAVVSLVCTVICIVIIVFIALFFYDVISQIIDFIKMLYYDLSIR